MCDNRRQTAKPPEGRIHGGGAGDGCDGEWIARWRAGGAHRERLQLPLPLQQTHRAACLTHRKCGMTKSPWPGLRLCLTRCPWEAVLFPLCLGGGRVGPLSGSRPLS